MVQEACLDMEASWSWRPACKPRRGTVRSKEMEDDRTEKTPSHEARLRTEVFKLVIAAEGSRFLLVFFFDLFCVFFGFRFDPYTKHAEVTGMATTGAGAVCEVFFGVFLWFSADSSALHPSLSL